jgi:hypothetical protein
VTSVVDLPTPSKQIAKMTLNDTERQLLEASEIHSIGTGSGRWDRQCDYGA